MLFPFFSLSYSVFFFLSFFLSLDTRVQPTSLTVIDDMIATSFAKHLTTATLPSSTLTYVSMTSLLPGDLEILEERHPQLLTRERERETDRQTDRETEREKEREVAWGEATTTITVQNSRSRKTSLVGLQLVLRQTMKIIVVVVIVEVDSPVFVSLVILTLVITKEWNAKNTFRSIFRIVYYIYKNE